MKNIRFIDLFAGIGGFRYGLEKSSKKYKCVWSSEWDKYASSIYRYWWGKVDTRDIKKVKSSEIPNHDLLCAGFPCQAFSIAGKRRGFEDTRGTLFFEIARILRDKRPRYFLLENVKGLLSHNEGKTFQTILGIFTDLGYEYQWQVLNSKNFGVPQNRERVFIVGHIRGTPRPKVFPIGEGNKKNDDKRILAHTLNSSDWRGANRNQKQTTIQQLNNPIHSNDRVYSVGGISPTLNSMQGGRRQPKIARFPLRFLNRNQRNMNGDYSFTVDGANTGGVKQGMKIRRLTPIECERLQGFPDNFTKYGFDERGNKIEISDTQRYKCLGNAVTTNVITWIGNKLLKEL